MALFHNLVYGAKSEKISDNESGCLFWLIQCDSDTYTKKIFNKHKFLSFSLLSLN